MTLVGLLEKARQYKAVLALYRIMTRDGYDFYENNVLNGKNTTVTSVDIRLILLYHDCHVTVKFIMI